MGRIRPWPALVLSLALASCAAEPGVSRLASQDSLVAFVQTHHGVGPGHTPLVDGCGGATERPAGTSGAYLVLSLDLCLACRDVGWLARQLGREPLDEPTVLVPSSEIAPVCDFLRRERAQLPVVGIPDGRIRRWLPKEHLMMAQLAEDGSVLRVMSAPVGWQLLAHWRAEVPARH